MSLLLCNIIAYYIVCPIKMLNKYLLSWLRWVRQTCFDISHRNNVKLVQNGSVRNCIWKEKEDIKSTFPSTTVLWLPCFQSCSFVSTLVKSLPNLHAFPLASYTWKPVSKMSISPALTTELIKGAFNVGRKSLWQINYWWRVPNTHNINCLL